MAEEATRPHLFALLNKPDDAALLIGRKGTAAFVAPAGQPFTDALSTARSDLLQVSIASVTANLAAAAAFRLDPPSDALYLSGHACGSSGTAAICICRYHG
jgi:hypothetical protein